MPDIPQATMQNWAGILNNGNRAQDAENVLLNRISADMYLYRLMDLAMSVFEWKNLPEGVDARMLEFWLLRDGFCVFFHDEDLKAGSTRAAAPEGYAVLQAMISGQWDIYNYPKDRRAYATNGFNAELNEENSVLIFNDYLRVPMLTTLSLYAKRLGEIDRTIDVNVMNQKTPKIIRCDEKQRLTFKNLAMQVDGNIYWIFGDKNLDLKNIDILDISSPYIANDMQVLKHQLWNEALTYLGIENANTDKRERLIGAEVKNNLGDVSAQRWCRLNAREQACDEINKLLENTGYFSSHPEALPVEVGFRKLLTGDSEHLSVTEDEQEMVEETETGEGESNTEESMLSRFKKWLGLGGENE